MRRRLAGPTRHPRARLTPRRRSFTGLADVEIDRMRRGTSFSHRLLIQRDRHLACGDRREPFIDTTYTSSRSSAWSSRTTAFRTGLPLDGRTELEANAARVSAVRSSSEPRDWEVGAFGRRPFGELPKKPNRLRSSCLLSPTSVGVQQCPLKSSAPGFRRRGP